MHVRLDALGVSTEDEYVVPRVTRPQWEAARMLIAWLRAQAVGDTLDYASVGIEWLETPDQTVACTDGAVDIKISDIFYASLMLLWSVVQQEADLLDEATAEEAVARLGLGLAHIEPSE
jgi:hypothetical protein